MDHSLLEVRTTSDKGRGLFARRPIPKGTLLTRMEGWLARGDELRDDWLALQVGADLWLCSRGDLLDDCGNHSCEPNAGFVTGETVLYALRDIQADEEICWDYSTSISEPGWRLQCLCGASTCRGTIRPWGELGPAERERLLPIALHYLRGMRASTTS